MIGLFFWLRDTFGLSAALFSYLALGVLLGLGGLTGRIIGLALIVVSVLAWVAPAAVYTALSLFGLCALIVGTGAGLLWGLSRVWTSRGDRYTEAAAKAQRTGDRAALDAWWRPTLLERLTAWIPEKADPLEDQPLPEPPEQDPPTAPLPPVRPPNTGPTTRPTTRPTTGPVVPPPQGVTPPRQGEQQ